MPVKVETMALGELATNTYIVENTLTGELLVVDPAIPSENLLKRLRGKNVKYILLTHGHFDHIGGAAAVKEQTGAGLVIHSLDAECLCNGYKSLFSYHYPNAEIPATTADIIVEDGSALDFGGVKIRIMHTSGHTVGGVCYIMEDERIIFTGDTLFHLSAGRTDFEGGSPRQELHSLAKISALEGDYKVYCGHGESTTLEYERQNNHYVQLSKKIK